MNNQNIALKPLNTFSFSCQAKHFFSIEEESHLDDLLTLFPGMIQQQKFYLLGDGSNTLFVDETIELIIKSNLKGIETWQTDDDYYISAAAGENWHQLVLLAIEQGMYGLENLALIPGSVGAAPIQNVGAYGVELADVCYQVHWYNFATGRVDIMSNEACGFGYRDSIFKHALKNKGMIINVVFKLTKQWQAKLSYQGLAELTPPITANDIMDKVIEIRRSKLPDPHDIPNAGSFYKNPVITIKAFKLLQQQYPNIPFYPKKDEQIKLAAGWLIEQSGLKGFQYKSVAVHNKQALVLVNNKQGSGQDLIQLAKIVRESVFNKFNVWLEPEVRFVSKYGEINPLSVLEGEQ